MMNGQQWLEPVPSFSITRTLHRTVPDLSIVGRAVQRKDADERMECDFVIGCCWLLRKEVFEQLGGFDADYYINHWEVDYCLRAIDRGSTIVYEPKAVVKHKILPGGTINKERLYYLYRNKFLLFKNFSAAPEVDGVMFSSPLRISHRHRSVRKKETGERIPESSDLYTMHSRTGC